ncbi:MAG: hypothetical protein LCH79_16490 [Proteobacteria bacterium]|nr:hypothetical protein [Pseudomonadota bacterium]
MHTAETVAQFPTDRASIRRLAQNHADAGQPLQVGLFSNITDQLAYEHAYNARARDLAGEIAECA